MLLCGIGQCTSRNITLSSVSSGALYPSRTAALSEPPPIMAEGPSCAAGFACMCWVRWSIKVIILPQIESPDHTDVPSECLKQMNTASQPAG